MPTHHTYPRAMPSLTSRTLIASLALTCTLPDSSTAQAPRSTGRVGSAPPKIARATRIVGAAPHVDGELNDPAWQQATVISDFVQKVPVEGARSEEHTSELQSRLHLVCRLLLEKKK